MRLRSSPSAARISTLPVLRFTVCHQAVQADASEQQRCEAKDPAIEATSRSGAAVLRLAVDCADLEQLQLRGDGLSRMCFNFDCPAFCFGCFASRMGKNRQSSQCPRCCRPSSIGSGGCRSRCFCPRRPRISIVRPKASSTMPHQRLALMPRLRA